MKNILSPTAQTPKSEGWSLFKKKDDKDKGCSQKCKTQLTRLRDNGTAAFKTALNFTKGQLPIIVPVASTMATTMLPPIISYPLLAAVYVGSHLKKPQELTGKEHLKNIFLGALPILLMNGYNAIPVSNGFSFSNVASSFGSYVVSPFVNVGSSEIALTPYAKVLGNALYSLAFAHRINKL